MMVSSIQDVFLSLRIGHVSQKPVILRKHIPEKIELPSIYGLFFFNPLLFAEKNILRYTFLQMQPARYRTGIYGAITPVTGVITLLLAGRGPLCRILLSWGF